MKRIASKILKWFLREPRANTPELGPQDDPWNRFVDYVCSHELDEMRPDVRPAYLVFWYMAEVENGGHLQYFLNKQHHPVKETNQALSDFGAADLADVFQSAALRWTSVDRNEPGSVDEYVSLALENEFGAFDKAFGETDPSADEVLSANIPSKFFVID